MLDMVAQAAAAQIAFVHVDASALCGMDVFMMMGLMAVIIMMVMMPAMSAFHTCQIIMLCLFLQICRNLI